LVVDHHLQALQLGLVDDSPGNRHHRCKQCQDQEKAKKSFHIRGKITKKG
jgi:hypothetical protein